VVIDNRWSKISCHGAEAKTNSAPLSQMLAAPLLGNAQALDRLLADWRSCAPSPKPGRRASL